MFYAQHVPCYDSGSVERPILSDDFFLIRCKMQIKSGGRAIEYITTFMLSTCKKYKAAPEHVDVVVTNVFPEDVFFTQANK